jgi:leader peptidase (prepilin peptidase) / N-methyltransferase
MPYAVAAVAGLLVGSFLNVVVRRMPAGESVVGARSHCPSCGHQIRVYDNVPVLSWLLLRGRCRDCGAAISVRYPLVEALTAALYVAVVAVKGPDEDALLGLALVTFLVPIALIDLDHRLILNKLTAPAAVVAMVLLLTFDRGAILEHLIAAAAAGGFLLVAALAYPSGMGMGDVKLAAVLGLYLGRDVGVALLVALVAGTIVGLTVIARKGAADGRKTTVPFGPFLAAGGVTALLVGEPLIDAYLDTF